MNYELIQGDCIQVMRGLPANSVQTCITSPPYFGLRDYGTATWEGGDAACEHSTGNQVNMTKDSGTNRDGIYSSGVRPGSDNSHCRKCGARRVDDQIGLEPTVDAYVAKLVDVFREVRRVLHPSGTVWLNLGDSYNGSGGAGGDYGPGGLKEGQPKYPGRNVNGLKPKDLCMIPARVAIALQEDGWWLRQEIVWHKRAPMPESVTDRCTRAHEMVYMLTKSPTYFYDHVAIMEPNAPGYDTMPSNGEGSRIGLKLASERNDYDSTIARGARRFNGNGRNKRSVWTLGPENSGVGGHFAVMPTKLVEPCVLAGSSQYGACSKCFAPWERVTEREPNNDGYANGPGGVKRFDERGNHASAKSTLATVARYSTQTTGWVATCDCAADIIPCTVLDCFSGAATVGVVAIKYGRRYVGIDLNAEYNELGRKRLEQVQPMLEGLFT